MRPHVKDDDRKWKKLLKRLRPLGQEAYLSVGLHADAEPYEKGQENPATVAQVASFHEFGTDTIPARPFFRPTVDGRRDEYSDLLDRTFTQFVKGKLTLRQAFGLVGTQVASDVKQAITEVSSPPLAESTVIAKMRKAEYLGAEKAADYAAGGANPLIDTGHMRASVTYKVSLDGKLDGPKGVGEDGDGGGEAA